MKFYTLTTACEYKGISRRKCEKHHHLQPMFGYSEWMRGKKRFWPEDEVERWSTVFDGQEMVYAHELLRRNNPALKAHVADVMATAWEEGQIAELVGKGEKKLMVEARKLLPKNREEKRIVRTYLAQLTHLIDFAEIDDEE